jgi:hypothetical protein
MVSEASPTAEPTEAAAKPREEDVEAIDRLRELHQKIRTELARVIIGQDDVIEINY